MQIQPNTPDSNPNLRFDPTRGAREVQKSRAQAPEAQSPETPSADLDAGAARIKEARDEYYAQRQQRVSNLRQNYTRNHPTLVEDGIKAARDDYRDKLEVRRQNTQASQTDSTKSDSIDIQAVPTRLNDEVVKRLDSVDSERAERIQQLRSLYLDGRLNTRELIERAAKRLLGG
ncbi:MAG: hypothetical protein HUU28_10515 [Planctomycetaceae bacterium]|nr:hypothetical protein [Planctomycetaceae bacterium]